MSLPIVTCIDRGNVGWHTCVRRPDVFRSRSSTKLSNFEPIELKWPIRIHSSRAYPIPFHPRRSTAACLDRIYRVFGPSGLPPGVSTLFLELFVPIVSAIEFSSSPLSLQTKMTSRVLGQSASQIDSGFGLHYSVNKNRRAAAPCKSVLALAGAPKSHGADCSVCRQSHDRTYVEARRRT